MISKLKHLYFLVTFLLVCLDSSQICAASPLSTVNSNNKNIASSKSGASGNTDALVPSSSSSADSSTSAAAVVVPLASAADSPCAAAVDVDEILYDQRQNGSQNVRVHLDDVTLILAPAESILAYTAINQGGTGGGGGAVASSSAVAATSTEKPNKDKLANDPYEDFADLLDSATFLKNNSNKQKLQAAQQGQYSNRPAKNTKCSGEACKLKRNKIILSKLLPILANRQQLLPSPVANNPIPASGQ